MRVIRVDNVPQHSRALAAIRAAKDAVFGSEQVRLEPDADNPDIAFDLTARKGYATLGPKQFYELAWLKGDNGDTYSKPVGYVRPDLFVANALRRTFKPETQYTFGSDVLYFDTETRDSDERWDLPPEKFFRLGQYAFGEDEPTLTEDIDEIRSAVLRAKMIVGHNIHAFDLSYLFGNDQPDVKVFDTWTHALVHVPAPYRFLTRSGSSMSSKTPGEARRWFGLDNLLFQFGLGGKLGDLNEMAKRHGCSISDIPMDAEYREYAAGDVTHGRELARMMFTETYPVDYDWREQDLAAINAQITRNGFKVDLTVAGERAAFLEGRKEELLHDLERDYDFPQVGKQPWRSKAGKEAIIKLLGPDAKKLPKTKKGNISLSGEAVQNATAGTEKEMLGLSLAELMGQRTLAQLALDSVKPDGFVHPEIDSIQRSARWSVTNPGLTVWTTRGDGLVEKSYFVADSDEHELVEFDFSSADPRVVAGYSGDELYGSEMTSDDFDAHEQSGRWLYAEQYDTDPKKFRQEAKKATNGYPYGVGARKITAQLSITLAAATRFIDNMKRKYRKVALWMDRAREAGKINQLYNDWGRRLWVETDRYYTQSPALLGQNGTREIMGDALIRLRDQGLLCYIKITVHDAVVCSFPKKHRDYLIKETEKCMVTTWKGVLFKVEHGEPSDNWMGASH